MSTNINDVSPVETSKIYIVGYDRGVQDERQRIKNLFAGIANSISSFRSEQIDNLIDLITKEKKNE